METRDPGWELVTASIAALDGVAKVMVSLLAHDAGDSCMLISGAWGGRVMVNATNHELDYVSVVDGAQPITTRLLCVGGQDGEYHEPRIVPIEWALVAARTFYESGRLEPTLRWDKD